MEGRRSAGGKASSDARTGHRAGSCANPKLRAYAAKALRRRGIDLRLNTAVKEVRPDSVVVQQGESEPETIPAAVTIWATYAAVLGYVFGDTFDHTTALILAFVTALGINALIELIRHLRARHR